MKYNTSLWCTILGGDRQRVQQCDKFLDVQLYKKLYNVEIIG